MMPDKLDHNRPLCHGKLRQNNSAYVRDISYIFASNGGGGYGVGLLKDLRQILPRPTPCCRDSEI